VPETPEHFSVKKRGTKPPNPFRCPQCGKEGRWRSGGPQFDNEMICSESHTWFPDEVYETWRSREMEETDDFLL